jgi:UMF1 family MFS transporter
MPYQADDDDATLHQPRVRYEGEDTSLTTPRELKGWLAYPIAAEVFAVVAVGRFALFKAPLDAGC